MITFGVDGRLFDDEFARTGSVEVEQFPRARLAAQALLLAVPAIVVGVVGLWWLLSEDQWMASGAAASGAVVFAAGFRRTSSRVLLARHLRNARRPQFSPLHCPADQVRPGQWMLVDGGRASRVEFVETKASEAVVVVTLSSGSVRVLGLDDGASAGVLVPSVMSPAERSAAAGAPAGNGVDGLQQAS